MISIQNWLILYLSKLNNLSNSRKKYGILRSLLGEPLKYIRLAILGILGHIGWEKTAIIVFTVWPISHAKNSIFLFTCWKVLIVVGQLFPLIQSHGGFLNIWAVWKSFKNSRTLLKMYSWFLFVIDLNFNFWRWRTILKMFLRETIHLVSTF